MGEERQKARYEVREANGGGYIVWDTFANRQHGATTWDDSDQAQSYANVSEESRS